MSEKTLTPIIVVVSWCRRLFEWWCNFARSLIFVAGALEIAPQPFTSSTWHNKLHWMMIHQHFCYCYARKQPLNRRPLLFLKGRIVGRWLLSGQNDVKIVAIFWPAPPFINGGKIIVVLRDEKIPRFFGRMKQKPVFLFFPWGVHAKIPRTCKSFRSR